METDEVSKDFPEKDTEVPINSSEEKDHEQEDEEICEIIEENGDDTAQDLQENMENVDEIAQDVPENVDEVSIDLPENVDEKAQELEKTYTEAQLDAGKQQAEMHKMTVDIKTNENLKEKTRALLLILNDEQNEPDQPTELNIPCVDINDSDVSNDDNEAPSSNVMEVEKKSENVDDVVQQLCEILDD